MLPCAAFEAYDEALMVEQVVGRIYLETTWHVRIASVNRDDVTACLTVEQAKRVAVARPVAPTPVDSFFSSVSYFLKGNEERADEEVRRKEDVEMDRARRQKQRVVVVASGSNHLSTPHYECHGVNARALGCAPRSSSSSPPSSSSATTARATRTGPRRTARRSASIWRSRTSTSSR